MTMRSNASPEWGSLTAAAGDCLAATDATDKCRLTARVAGLWSAGLLPLDRLGAAGPCQAGRPQRPALVHPRRVARRGLGSIEGRAAFLHAIAHIEFNAVNLAWDAVYRFRDQPREYYSDWVRVAAEEARHFAMLRRRLNALGADYGDYDAHDGLWTMAQRTADDVLVRMALVPRVLEARGLDVTPAMIDKLLQAGDHRSAAVLKLILRDEVGHVRIGSRWFAHACAGRNLDPQATFSKLLGDYLDHPPHGPFNRAARLAGGFTAEELAMLEGEF